MYKMCILILTHRVTHQVRETCWAELPSELWWHVLRCLTAKQGKAVSCTCQTMSHLVQLPAFIWAPAQLHLGLVQVDKE